MKIHEWIKTYRDRECLTQQQLADTIQCSVSSIRAWESGEREPSAAVLMRLTLLLGIPDSLEVMGMKFAKRNIPGTGKTLLGIDRSGFDDHVREKWNKRHPDKPMD